MPNSKYTAELDSTGAWITTRTPGRVYATAAQATDAAEEADRSDARRAAANARRATASYKLAMERIAEAQAPATTEAPNRSHPLGRGIHHRGDGYTTYESTEGSGRYDTQIWDQS